MMDNKLAVAGMVGGIVGGLVGAVAVTLATRGNILYRLPSRLSFISCSPSFKTGAIFYTDNSIYIACPPSFWKILIRTTGHLGYQRQLYIQITFLFIICFLLVDSHLKQGGGRASIGCTRETHEAAESLFTGTLSIRVSQNEIFWFYFVQLNHWWGVVSRAHKTSFSVIDP